MCLVVLKLWYENLETFLFTVVWYDDILYLGRDIFKWLQKKEEKKS